MPHHQLAYLTADRMVAWKRLSAIGKDQPIRPVAYASRSPRFFPELLNAGPLPGPGGEQAAVLWVCSAPKYQGKLAFPPTLTARIAVREVLSGDVVKSWATDPTEAELREKYRGKPRSKAWREARSVEGAARRSIFRITRVYARLAKHAARKKKKSISTDEAWRRVRVAVADPRGSYFLPHIDATLPLSKLFNRPDLPGQEVAERSRKVGHVLLSPWRVPGDRLPWIQDLEALSETALREAVFLSYRWNEHTGKVIAISQALLRQGRAVWLDGLSIPDFEDRREKGKKYPEVNRLERLLFEGIDRSALFLACAAGDFCGPPRGEEEGENWAHQEFRHAAGRFEKQGRPDIRVVCLAECPEELKKKEWSRWRYKDNPEDIAGRVVRVLEGA